RWAFMRWADIESAQQPGRVYLRRLRIIQTPWAALYLHFIFEADYDRHPHDHPCNFWSLVLRGGYTEQVYTMSENLYFNEVTWRRRWSIHKMPIEAAHRITVLAPRTVTLCLFGRRQRNWGFWTEGGFVEWQEYERSMR